MGHQWTPGPEQGVIGLRLDHLCRHAATRAAVVGLLTPPGANPLKIAQNIPGPAGRVINVFDDDITAFENALEALTPGRGAAYHADAGTLRTRNQDTPADRQHYKDFWLSAARRNRNLIPQMRGILLTALQSPNVRFKWDCVLPGGSPPDVLHVNVGQASEVRFRTDNSDPPTP